jgi:hypothetical protein
MLPYRRGGCGMVVECVDGPLRKEQSEYKNAQNRMKHTFAMDRMERSKDVELGPQTSS